MNMPLQRPAAPASFGERVLLAAILALIALIPRLTAWRTDRTSFTPDPFHT